MKKMKKMKKTNEEARETAQTAPEKAPENETTREFLLRKKAKDGRLNALGEWLLSRGEDEVMVINDMRAVLK